MSHLCSLKISSKKSPKRQISQIALSMAHFDPIVLNLEIYKNFKKDQALHKIR